MISQLTHLLAFTFLDGILWLIGLVTLAVMIYGVYLLIAIFIKESKKKAERRRNTSSKNNSKKKR